MPETTAPEYLTRAADRLDALAAEATPAPWTVTEKSARYGGLVCVDSPNATAPELEGYGGEVVGESMSPGNRALVAALRPLAPFISTFLRDQARDWDEDEPAESLLPGAFPEAGIARSLLGDAETPDMADSAPAVVTPSSPPVHLGDGAYAWNDGYYIWVQASRPPVTHQVALEPGAFLALVRYAVELTPEFADAIIRAAEGAR